jgi:hypothetical protein
MRVGIIQSCYVPWRGFFDFIDSVDLFVIFDDVAYPIGRSWRSRNQVKTRDGLKWMTVPVSSETTRGPIDEVLIADGAKPWREEHARLLRQALGGAPHFPEAMKIWQEGVSAGDRYLSALNVRLIKLTCQYLGITTPIVRSRQYGAQGVKTGRLVDLCRKAGATAYLSGPTAKGYIEEDLFAEAGIALEYKRYDYPPYPQQWGRFEGTVTVLDLIANCGERSRDYLKSRTPDELVVPAKMFSCDSSAG